MSENTTDFDPRQLVDDPNSPATLNLTGDSDTHPEPHQFQPSMEAAPSAMDDFGLGKAGLVTVTYPARFGPYELLGEVARGGMGVVYKAKQTGLDRIVALKMVLGLQDHGTTAKRFIQEAKATSKLDHPNIVPIFDCGQIEGRLYFTMPFVNGPSLKALVDKDGLPPIGRTISLFVQIVGGVAAAHRQGIVHRDLKPANILVDSDGRPRVADFGLAKQVDDLDRPEMTGTGQIMGTPAYMSPEQARESKDVTAASDVYSLGAILYFLLTGRAPFTGENIADLLIQVVSVVPKPPKELKPTVPEDVQAICLKCLEKLPENRYPTAMALAEAMVPVVDRYLTPSGVHRPIQTVPTLLDSVSSVSASVTELEHTTMPTLPARSRAPWWLALAAAVLIGGALTAYFWPKANVPVVEKPKDEPTKPTPQPETTPDVKPAIKNTVPISVPIDDRTWPLPKGDFAVTVEMVAKAKADASGVLQLAEKTPLELRVRAEVDSWIYVFVVDSDDNAILLFPNDDEPENRVAAGVTRVIPSKQSYALQTTPTIGDDPERIRVVATTKEQVALKAGQPIGKYQAFKNKVEKDELKKSLRQLRGIEIVPKKVATPDNSKVQIGEAELRFHVK